jgi:ketosteroid isomerase-like protein
MSQQDVDLVERVLNEAQNRPAALWTGPFDEWGYEVGEVIDAGDSVVAQIHQWGRGKGSGAGVESRFWQAWTISDGKIVRATHHSEKAEALEAAGLPEYSTARVCGARSGQSQG